jgi:hypothetical protein
MSISGVGAHSLILTVAVTSCMMILCQMVGVAAQRYTVLQHDSFGNCHNMINSDILQEVSRPSIREAGLNVQNGPLTVAIDNKTNVAYVANSASNTVSSRNCIAPILSIF